MKKFKRKINGKAITLFVSKSRPIIIDKSYRCEFRGDRVKETLTYYLLPERGLSHPMRDLLYDDKSMAILHAHGANLNGKWVYEDETFFGKKYIPVQNWINKNDGKYDTLVITACGTKSDIESKKSKVLHAKEDFSVDELMRHQIQMQVYLPGKGYLPLIEDKEQEKNL